MASTYAWIITADKISEPGDGSDVGVAGPSDASEAMIAQAKKSGRAFKMYDDDGILYYHGRYVESDNADGEDMFGPLDDFGTPNAGCTEIKYRNDDGTWYSL